MTFENALDAIATEFSKAKDKHPSCPSAHHAMSVIREEYLELEREVFTDGIDHNEVVRTRARKEAIQLAATCIRMLEVLGTTREGR